MRTMGCGKLDRACVRAESRCDRLREGNNIRTHPPTHMTSQMRIAIVAILQTPPLPRSSREEMSPY